MILFLGREETERGNGTERERERKRVRKRGGGKYRGKDRERKWDGKKCIHRKGERRWRIWSEKKEE